MNNQTEQERAESLGPAEQVINTLTTFTDHVVHNRPGMVTKDARTSIGARWQPVTWIKEGDEKVVYAVRKVGKKIHRTRLGLLNGTCEIREEGRVVGEYRKPGIYPEAAAYFYNQVATVWKLDNDFAARWASWSFPREHKDLKVVLCAFMLAQTRRGDAVLEDGEVPFYDNDYRAVGEAMCLIRRKDKNDISPKLLLRVGQLLNLPAIAEINRELGFANSPRNPHLGRYKMAVEKWLRYREDNLPMLKGLVKAGFTSTVQKLAQSIRYKPSSAKFFETLNWTQRQSPDGHREIAIGEDFRGDSWTGMGEKEICELITQDCPNWKRIIGMVPPEVGMTQAILAAAVEADCLSDKDLIIMSPTIEEFGLHKVPAIQKRWKEALANAEDRRAVNIARNVKSKEMKEGLQEAADKATEKAFEEVTRNLRVYCIVDISSSMHGALTKAQEYLTKFLGGFPLDRLHVSVFNSESRELTLKSASTKGVENAFAGISAGGTTSYAAGWNAVAGHVPEDGEDLLALFVGDEEDSGWERLVAAVRRAPVKPVAFGLLKVKGVGRWAHGRGSAVTSAAAKLGIPCFPIDTDMFESDDPYAITRLLQNLIAATPVGERVDARVPARKTLVQEILGTELLTKPVWA